ncbi:hypothetical protein BJ742DRAFT_737228 [Cladochytrium replicatum]|nr:hypothetical protein BJ742DRAFT_737228 [Cladochytrium replicatum]
MGGISPLVKLLQLEDNRTKQCAAHAAFAAARNDRNQVYFRDSGAQPVLASMLNSGDAGVISATANANKAHDVKLRSKIRAYEGVPSITKLLSHEDPCVFINTAECVAKLSEDWAKVLVV